VQHRRALPLDAESVRARSISRSLRLAIEVVTTVGSALLLSYLILYARW
jgi:hypothetical protein